MKLINYVNSKVHITLTTPGFYYQGLVLDADDDSITLRDKTGKLVTVKSSLIESIREIEK
jgi:hypothetical protein